MAAAALATVALTLAHPASTRQFTWPWVLVLTAVWIAPVMAFLATRETRHWPGRPLTSGLLLLAGATLVSALFSPFDRLSLPRVWPALGGVALSFWLHHWLAASTSRARRLALGLAGFGAILAACSLLLWRWQSPGIPWSVRNAIPFGHSNYTAGAMLLVLPWLALAGWQAAGLPRLAWALAALTGLAVLLTTSSRAGVLALGAVVAGGVIFALVRTPWSPRRKLALGLATVALLCLTVLANPRLRDLALGGGWSDIARESNTQRSAMVQAGALLGSERPLLGWGPGTVPLAYPKVRAQLAGGVDNVLQLHCTPVQLWATLGTAGLTALGLLAFATAQRIRAVLRAPGPVPLTAAAALLAYGLFAFTDHQLDLPALNALLVLNLALLFTAPNPAAPPDQSNLLGYFGGSAFRGIFTGLAASLLAIPLWRTTQDLHARHAYEQALAALGDGQTESALAHLETAAQRAPHDPYYRHQLAGRLLALRATEGDRARRDELAATAAEHLRLSLAAGCFEEYAHVNLAWLALDAGSAQLANRHFRSALTLAPHRGGAYFGLGLALRETGELHAAIRAFALEWINDPIVATHPIWAHPDFTHYRPAIVREAGALLDELAPAHGAAVYTSKLWAWWNEAGPPPATGFNRETDRFAATLTAITRGEPLPAGAQDHAWGRLLDTWLRTPDDFSALSPLDPAFAATLARRAARHPAPAVHGFLTAGPEDETNLLLAMRAVRTGYGVLALHPDGPPLADVPVRQIPRLVSTFAPDVFPARGWLPARELLRRLPATANP
jgi:O-antigen ligase